MQFVLVPTWDREGKVCANCGSKLGVRYKRKSDNKYFCNMCALQLVTIADYMALGQEPPAEDGYLSSQESLDTIFGEGETKTETEND